MRASTAPVVAHAARRIHPAAIACAAGSCAVGGAIVLRPPFAVIAVGAALASAWLCAGKARGFPALFSSGLILVSGFVDLPRMVTFAGFTLLAFLTAALVLAAAILVLPAGVGLAVEAIRECMFLFLLVGWMTLVTVADGLSIQAVQNLLVYFLLLAAVALAYMATVHEASWAGRLNPLVAVATTISLVLYAGSFALGGAGSGAVITPRPFALFATIGVSWAIAGWRLGSRRARNLAILITLFVLLSLSRLAFAVTLILACLAWVDLRSARNLLRAFATALLVGVAAYVSIAHFAPLREHLFTGDLVQLPGGISINVSGRAKFWHTVWESARSHIFVGQGAGSADRLVQSKFGADAGHPHNDFLRLIHDGGLVALGLWLVFAFGAIRRLGRDFLDAGLPRLHRRVAGAAYLAVVALLLAMTTDNALIYTYVIGPTGVLIGTAYGLARGRREL